METCRAAARRAGTTLHRTRTRSWRRSQQAYGIDLERDSLHWWKFRRLMFGLPGDTPFMQRVQYRVADLDKLPKEQRKHYRKMRRLYALKQPEKRHRMTAEERDAAMKARVRRRFEEARHASEN